MLARPEARAGKRLQRQLGTGYGQQALNPAVTPLYRVAVLLGLVAIYVLCCGDLTVAPRVFVRLFLVYLSGAVTALYYKGEQIGTLQPISMRPVFIVAGALLMAASLIWTLAIKGHL